MANNNGDEPRENQVENFDAVYRREMELQKELEKVEIAYVKTVEKYGQYGECKSFLEYLRTIEKVFMEAKFRNWDGEKNKDELIKTKIKMIAEASSVSEDVLNSIYDDFKKSGAAVGKIYEIVNQLLEKYGKSAECAELILYIQFLFINFDEAEKDKFSMEELKDRLVRARMEVLASDGNPELKTLENIYREFKSSLSITNN
jgi:hypothetical protein